LCRKRISSLVAFAIVTAAPANAAESWYCETEIVGHMHEQRGMDCYTADGRNFSTWCPGAYDSVGEWTVNRNDGQAIVATSSDVTKEKFGLRLYVITVMIDKVTGGYARSTFDGLKQTTESGNCSTDRKSLRWPSLNR
jgi:hypothetical protein